MKVPTFDPNPEESGAENPNHFLSSPAVNETVRFHENITECCSCALSQIFVDFVAFLLLRSS